jgi:hypothetical protein
LIEKLRNVWPKDASIFEKILRYFYISPAEWLQEAKRQALDRAQITSLRDNVIKCVGLLAHGFIMSKDEKDDDAPDDVPKAQRKKLLGGPPAKERPNWKIDSKRLQGAEDGDESDGGAAADDGDGGDESLSSEERRSILLYVVDILDRAILKSFYEMPSLPAPREHWEKSCIYWWV